MVATDTMVGIIGALALVAVMVGVFVYEYNNEPTADGGAAMTDGENRTAFEEAFGGLNATDDLDEDGAANYLDDDIDGDGQNNTADEMTMYERPVDGSVGAQATSISFPLEVGTGAANLEVTITVAGDNGLPADATLTVTNGDGETVGEESGNGEITVSSSELTPGSYTITVARQASAGGPLPVGTPFSFSGTASVHYEV